MISPQEQQLYQAVILEHNRKPKNFRKLVDFTHSREGYNPLCGDHFWVYLKINPQNIIDDISFEGNGCAISKASASLMTENLKGKDVLAAKELFTNFQQMIKGEKSLEVVEDKIGKLKIFSGISEYPSRIKCAALAWHALKSALDNLEEKVSTE